MNLAPAYQMYANDWLSSPKIMLMSPAEEGAYIRLLNIAWNAPDCGLPDDDDQLAALSRLGEGWFKGGSTKVRDCFFSKRGRLFNKRLLAERKKQREWKRKSSEGGKASAKSRAERKLQGKGGSRVVDDCLVPKVNSSSPSSSSSTTSNIQKEHFDIFWKEYPKKVGKKDAFKAWTKATDKPPINMIVAVIRQQKQSEQWRKEGGQFIPNPQRWLNRGSWSDELSKPRQGAIAG